jgi:hypothetical protein
MPPGPSNKRDALGRLASRRRRSGSSSRALPRVSSTFRGAACTDFVIDRTKTAEGHHDAARCDRQPSLPLSDRPPNTHGTTAQPAAGVEPAASSARYRTNCATCSAASYQFSATLHAPNTTPFASRRSTAISFTGSMPGVGCKKGSFLPQVLSAFLVYMLPPLPRRSVWAYCFAHFTQPYPPSPKGSSGRPAHRPFRGLRGVHSRCGLHTRAVTNS